MSRYVPDAGDLVWAGRRPALVVTPRAYNEAAGLAVMCPVTSRVKGYPFEVALGQSEHVTGVVLADHVKSLDWRARNATLISHVPDAVLADVRAKLRPLLGVG